MELEESRSHYPNKQPAEQHANFGSSAAGKMQKPQGHHQEGQVHLDYALGGLLFSHRPTSYHVPEEEETADQANYAEHVLAGGRTDIFRQAGPGGIVNGQINIVLHEKDRQG